MSGADIISNDPLTVGVAIALMLGAVIIFTRNKNIALTVGTAGLVTISPAVGIIAVGILSIIGLLMWNRTIPFYAILGVGLYFIVLIVIESLNMLFTGTISY